MTTNKFRDKAGMGRGMKYEVFIKPGFTGADIDADSAKEAKERFVETLIDNISVDEIIANNLDTEDGNDPKVGGVDERQEEN